MRRVVRGLHGFGDRSFMGYNGMGGGADRVCWVSDLCFDRWSDYFRYRREQRISVSQEMREDTKRAEVLQLRLKG